MEHGGDRLITKAEMLELGIRKGRLDKEGNQIPKKVEGEPAEDELADAKFEADYEIESIFDEEGTTDDEAGLGKIDAEIQQLQEELKDPA